jgi:hypothetical protein
VYVDPWGGFRCTDTPFDLAGAIRSPIFQVAQAIVSDERLFIVLATERRADAEEQGRIGETLNRHAGSGRVVFVIEDGEGRATLEVSGEASGSIAAAMAVVRHSWGWDESAAFDITVNGTRHRVQVEHRGDWCWQCSCAEVRVR